LRSLRLRSFENRLRLRGDPVRRSRCSTPRTCGWWSSARRAPCLRGGQTTATAVTGLSSRLGPSSQSGSHGKRRTRQSPDRSRRSLSRCADRAECDRQSQVFTTLRGVWSSGGVVARSVVYWAGFCQLCRRAALGVAMPRASLNVLRPSTGDLCSCPYALPRDGITAGPSVRPVLSTPTQVGCTAAWLADYARFHGGGRA
jgi:hypothetical protein